MPQLADPAILQHRLEHGEWVVDLPARQAYAAAHVPGTVAIELDDLFATYLGWTVPTSTTNGSGSPRPASPS